MLPFCFGSSSLKLTLKCRFLCKFSIKEVLPGEAGVRVGEAREVTRGEDKQRPSLSLKQRGPLECIVYSCSLVAVVFCKVAVDT